jgi:hypothetical protein
LSDAAGSDAAGAGFDLFGWLRGLPHHGSSSDASPGDASPGDASPGEIAVLARVGPREGGLPIRLIAVRTSPEATEAARAKLRRAASRRQKTLDPRSLEAAAFVILGTSPWAPPLGHLPLGTSPWAPPLGHLPAARGICR